MSSFNMHDHIDLDDFRLAQIHAAVRGVDPRNSADAIWEWHDRIVAENEYFEAADPDVNMFGEAPGTLSEADAHRGLATSVTRQAG